MNERIQSIFAGLYNMASGSTVTNSFPDTVARRTRPTGTEECTNLNSFSDSIAPSTRPTGSEEPTAPNFFSGLVTHRTRLAGSNKSTADNSLSGDMARRARLVGFDRLTTDNSHSDVLSRRTHLRASDEPTTPPAKENDYEILSMPAPASPTMNMHGITSPLCSRLHTKWNTAADLTADWEDIDANSLQTATREPRPRTPLQIPPPLSALEKFTRDRSMLHAVARRADFWFPSGRLGTELVMGRECDSKDFMKWKMDVLDEIRVIMEHVEDAKGESDMKTVGEFFAKAAEALVGAEKSAEGEGLSVGDYCQCVAAALVKLGMTVRMDKFFVLKEIEGMVKTCKRAKNAEIKKALREQKAMDRDLAKNKT